ncbi:MAG: metal-sensitive transcriptional regulator [Chloroflexi bacterium]|nr:metal-sensitive transcriptional regulator [Chloroflexota bacterium]
MTACSKRDLWNRLLSAQGHVRAIAEMIDADSPYTETLRQMQAVRGSMRAIRRILLSTYLLDPECGLFAASLKEREQAWKKLRRTLVEQNRRK